MDLNQFKSQLSFRNKVVRLIWGCVWILFFRPSPRILHGWRRFLLRCFGARVGKGVRVYNSACIYYPPNLTLADNVVIGPNVDLYCVAEISIQKNSMISQYSYLCAASHDYRKEDLPLIATPITIGESTWVCAKAFVGPGVTIGNMVVVAACSVVVKDVSDYSVVGGNPCKFIKKRPPSDSTK